MTKKKLVMNEEPIVEMLAFFSRFKRINNPEWNPKYLLKMKEIRSCHSRTEGGVRKSYYSIETYCGQLVELIFCEDDLTWNLKSNSFFEGHVVDNVLAHIHRHKHKPQRAYRVTPYKFELIPLSEMETFNKTGLPFQFRIQPYRFKSGKFPSTQVISIAERHLEDHMSTKILHYVVVTDSKRYMHFYYTLDQLDWRFRKEIDPDFYVPV